VPLPVCVYHVTLLDGDDSSAGAAVVGVDGVEARGAVGSCGQHDVLVTGQRAPTLGTDVMVDVVAVTARLSALLGEYQLQNIITSSSHSITITLAISRRSVVYNNTTDW